MGKYNETFKLLLVEDNDADVFQMKEALREAGIESQLDVLDSGANVMQYLRKEGAYADTALPNLIILDLNLPGKGGLQVLKEIKSDAELRQTPVIILTNSRNDRDIKDCYAAHANCFLNKPLNFSDFTEIVRNMGRFWLDSAILP